MRNFNQGFLAHGFSFKNNNSAFKRFESRIRAIYTDLVSTSSVNLQKFVPS